MLSDTMETQVSCFLPGRANIRSTLKRWEKEDQIFYLRHHSGFVQPRDEYALWGISCRPSRTCCYKITWGKTS